ncbi:MAG TPA: translation elongation factor Ts [Acidimicrobiales bacterium]|nr:translation elongation factor Ts [Acidimicrobiales bacterium]
MAISAKEVQALRQATGAGMMDAKRALEESNGDHEAAALWLRERGLGKAAERSDRENAEGAIAMARNGNVAALVQLKCETDFVAKSPDFVNLANDLAQAVVDKGEGATTDLGDAIDDLKVTLKENIELGQVVRFEAPEGHVLDTYLHIQNGRGVNGILIELDGGTTELAHDIALTAAFSRPGAVTRDEVDAALVAAEREQLEKETLNEGKPENAVAKIVEGKLTGWFKRMPGGVLMDQPFAKEPKQSIAQTLGDVKIVRFAQVLIGE